MRAHYETILRSPLFVGIAAADLDHIITCFDINPQTFPADSYVFFQQDQVNYIYIVMTGSVEIIKETFSGARHIIAMLGPSQLFGEGIVCTKHRKSPVSVRTKEATTLVKLPYQKLMTPCQSVCGFHSQLIFNMMLLLGEKNYGLNQKIEILMLKGMKEKIAIYLLSERQRHGSDSFDLPMNRNELADYLNVSRPSMSRELSRMQALGLLSYQKNHFELLDIDQLMECVEDFD